jgi:hypothetical protein
LFASLMNGSRITDADQGRLDPVLGEFVGAEMVAERPAVAGEHEEALIAWPLTLAEGVARLDVST